MNIDNFINENTNLGGSVVSMCYSRERLKILLNKYEIFLKSNEFKKINIPDESPDNRTSRTSKNDYDERGFYRK